MAAAVLGAAVTCGAQENVISLPPLMVEERGIPLNWRYTAWPGAEVLSVCDDDTTAEFVRRHRRMEEMMAVLLPPRFSVQLAVPDAFVLFNEATGRARSREIVAEIARKEGATVAADGTVVVPPALPRGGFLGRGEQRIRFLPNIRLMDLDAVRIFAIVRDDGSPMDFVFTKDRLIFQLMKRAPALPDWFVEGMLELHGQIKFRADEIEFLPLTWLSPEESAALARETERPRMLLPMEDFFAAQRPAGDEPPTELERVWRAQCAHFVRWALTDPSGARREALWKLLDRLDGEPPSERIFRECFGLGYSDARDRLSDALPTATAQKAKLEVPEAERKLKVNVRAATDLEIVRIRGDWERLQISFVKRKYPALVGTYIDQARRTLRRAYERGERDPNVVALLGLLECDADERGLAREFLETAVAAKVVRPRVYLESALQRFNDVQVAAAGRKLTMNEVQAVLAPLLQGLRDAPPLAEAYTLMANVWLQSASRPTAAELQVLEEGARLFPGAAGLVMKAIHLHVSGGSYGPAAVLTDIGLRHARDAAVRERFARVRAELAPLVQ